MLARMKKDKEVIAAISSIFSHFLGESKRESGALARQWLRRHRESQSQFVMASFSPTEECRLRAGEIVMIDQLPVSHFINRCDSGVVLSTIHMGDYLHATLRLFSSINPREVLILRRQAWTEAAQATSKVGDFGHQVIPVIANPEAARTLLQGLRRGAIVVMLYDLPSRWGATKTVQVLDHPMRWVCGPSQLAMITRSCMVPFYCFESGGTPHCEFGAVRDYRKPRSSHITVQSEMQAMASAAETYIRRFVTQWENWRLIDEMIIHDMGA